MRSGSARRKTTKRTAPTPKARKAPAPSEPTTPASSDVDWDGDGDAVMTPPGQDPPIPSTAATSVVQMPISDRKKTAQQVEEEEEERRTNKKLKDSAGSAVRVRSTPQRASASRARTMLRLPRDEVGIEAESDSELSEAEFRESEDETEETSEDQLGESETERSGPTKPKGKGKGKSTSTNVSYRGRRKRKRAETDSQDDPREEVDSDVEAQLVAAAITESFEAPTASGSVQAKGRSKPSVIIPGRPRPGTSAPKTAAPKRQRTSRGGNAMNSSKAKGKGKGKGKARAVSPDEDADPSYNQDLAVASDGESAASSELSALDSIDEGTGGEASLPTTHNGHPRHATSWQPRERLSWWQKNQLALEKHHPELRNVWEDLQNNVKVVKPEEAVQPEGLSLKLLPFQKEGLYWMKKQEQGAWQGGMLADEMGMGKTIQTISLILSDSKPGDGRQTLVIAPTVAIMQWRNEFAKFTSGFNINVWHGGARVSDLKEMGKFDVVLTSFAVLESSYRRQNNGFKRKGELIREQSPLHAVKWHRVILDEAHNIKDRACNTAKGAFALQAKYRWCLSGTPLQNRVGELYSLIRFLGVDPFAYYYCKKCECKALHWMFSDKRQCDECGHSPMNHTCYWNNEILKPIQKYGTAAGSHGATAFGKLRILLQRMMLRRTKLERADDLGLPPRVVSVRRDYFTEEEEELYTSLYSDVTRRFSTYAEAGTVLNNYGNIFQLITRMRQMACHPDLVLRSKTARDISNQILGDTGTIHTCRICLDEAEDPIISKCRHIFCRECIRQYLETAIEQEPECQVCHLPLSIDLSQDSLDDEDTKTARQGMLDRLDPGTWRTSTKIEALLEELGRLNGEDSTQKSLVFSQYTSFLDLIERRLQIAGFKTARLQGSMTPEARDRTIKYFMNNNDVQVFLVSLKAGGVALNLTEASAVFLMDPWWNPAVELQAMDRIHRLGQHRPVAVKRFIIENSIESRIIQLGDKKRAMTGAALGDDDQALGRLTPEDLSFLFSL